MVDEHIILTRFLTLHLRPKGTCIPSETFRNGIQLDGVASTSQLPRYTVDVWQSFKSVKEESE